MEGRRGVHAPGEHVFGPAQISFERVLAAGDLDRRPYHVNLHNWSVGAIICTGSTVRFSGRQVYVLLVGILQTAARV